MSSPDTAEQAGGKTVFEADMLFATLDTSVRRIDARPVIFLSSCQIPSVLSAISLYPRQGLPVHPDEVCCADLLLEVVDFSDPDYRRQIEVTARTLRTSAPGTSRRLSLTKVDLALGRSSEKTACASPNPTRRGEIPTSPPEKDRDPGHPHPDRRRPGGRPHETGFLIPYKKGALLQEIRSCGVLLSEEYLPEGIRVRARCRREDALRISRLCGE